MSWTYTDTADQVIAVTECTTELLGAHIGINGRDGRSVIVCIPADKRRNAAQALAGEDHRVIPVTADDRPASEREIEQARADEAATMQEDLHSILHALGLSTAARASSPHQVVEHEIVPAIWRLRQKDPAYTDEDWREQIGRVLSLLGIEDGVIRRPPVDIIDTIRGKIDDRYGMVQRISHERDDPRKRLHEAEAQTADDHSRYTYDATCPKCRDLPAQPDRPEPVDPADVRVGDVVDMEHEDGIWRAVGPVTGVYPHPGGPEYYIFAVRIGVDDVPLSSKYASVCVLHRAEPEPDEAAVEALISALEERCGVSAPTRRDTWRDIARDLIRDHGVHMGVSE